MHAHFTIIMNTFHSLWVISRYLGCISPPLKDLESYTWILMI